MSIRSILKGYFNKGDYPTEAQFADFIDSTLNLDEDSYLKDIVEGTNVSIDKTDPKNPIISATGGESPYVPTSTIPDSEDALFWLDGSISSNEFIDVSGNNRNFTIINNDFNEDWTKGFPFKTAATISAPIGDATLIAADVNNFLYDSGGTPNQISPQSFFQNIDFANTLLCRHIGQVLDSEGYEITPSGIRDITLYDSARTIDSTYTDYFGSEIVRPTVNVYFVSKDGNDSNDGSWSTPFLTIDHALQTASNNDSIYILGGTYTEDSGTGHLVYDRNGIQLFVYGISTVIIDSTSSDYNVEKQDGDIDWYHIIFDGTGRIYNVFFQFDTGSLNKCILTNSATFNFLKWAGATSDFYDCAILDGVVNSLDANGAFKRNYAKNTYHTTTTLLIEYCKFVLSPTQKVYSNGTVTGITLRYNDFFFEAIAFDINAINSDNPFNLRITKNKFYLSGTSTGATYAIYLRAQDVTPTSNYTPIIDNNYFYDTSNNARTFAFIIINSPLVVEPVIEYNYFESITTEERDHLTINPNAGGIIGSSKIRFNRFITNSETGATCSFTESNIPAILDETEIIGNYFRGHFFENPTNISAGCHALLASNGKDMLIKYNRIDYYPLGIVVKSQGEAYTKNGVFYNIIWNCRAGFYYRRTSFLNTYGNTFANSEEIETGRFGAIDEQGAVNQAQGFVFSNNIFSAAIRGNASDPAFLIAANGLIGANPVDFNTNVFNEINTAVFIQDDAGTPTTYTYAQSVSNGWVQNGAQAVPLFNNLYFGGLELVTGSPGNGDGLTISDNIGLSELTILDKENKPVISTLEQKTAFDQGAYIKKF